MRSILSHGGSVASSLSYSNIDTTPAKKVQEISPGLEHIVMLLQKSNELLTQQVAELTKRLDAVKPVEQCSDMVEFKLKDGTIINLPKRNDTSTKYETTEDRDASIQKAVNALQGAGIKTSTDNLKKMGYSFYTITDWRGKLPLNFSANAKKCKDQPIVAPAAPPPRAPPPVVAPRELRERGSHVSDLPTQLPYGDKVILTKPNSTAAAKKMQLKRGRETFSGPENEGMTIPSDADCESGQIKTKVVKTDKGRDLSVRVCEEHRG
jgi:hypothetical protein